MESVGISEEYVMLNNPLNAPYIITSFYSSTLLFPQVSNMAAYEAKENVSGERGGNGRGEKSCHVGKGGKPCSFLCRGNYIVR